MTTAEQLISALTPSAETKARYIGEFKFTTYIVDEDGDEVGVEVTVPWTTTKEMMNFILKSAETM